MILLNGNTDSAKHWVVATGSSSAIPSFPGLESCDYITNKEIFSLQTLPASLIVLGAGPIAIEMAQSFARLGSKVTVIQRSDQILSKEDKDMADIAMLSLEEDGVQFYLGVGVKEVRDLGQKRQVIITDKSGAEIVVEGETLLVALGRKPNIEGLGLADIDVRMSPKGIEVNRRLRTNHAHIYAPGDVNGAFQFTHAAGYEGGIVVSNAIFHLPRKANYTWMPWATYCDPELASIGMNEKSAKAAGIEYQVWTEHFGENDRALAEGEGRGKIKMLLDRSEKPLGVQVIGPRAGDLLGEWVAILNGKVKLSTMVGAIHPYPTLAEINKRVVGSYLSPKIFSPMIKKGLKFFFNLQGSSCDPQSDPPSAQ
ncbi:MAG: FAD-dependent oxidoreductase [Spirochaetales bacterium]|jgi:pyruvate/2-oxoglutarate dehydrogenase complex dihydrolipoamide dehydrogenase (E3) component|nr:FAD-dependent oxidoreductase [Spirochaetales bacterium]